MALELTPDEQRFFESGGTQLPGSNTPPEDTPLNPLDLAGLGTAPPAPAPAPAVVETPAPPPSDATSAALELMRQTLAESNARVAELQTQFVTSQKTSAPAPDPGPDAATDPLGAMFHQLSSVNKQIADLQTKLNTQSDQQTQAANFTRFQERVNELRNEFVKTNADFPEAYKHLRENRINDMRSFGLSDTDIQKQLFQEEIQLSESAIRSGKNPAAAIYEMAKRHGYTNTPPAQTPAQKIAQLKAGVQAAAKNLPTTPVAAEDITLDTLKDASDDDLNKLVTNPALWAKITGGNNYPI